MCKFQTVNFKLKKKETQIYNIFISVKINNKNKKIVCHSLILDA